MRFFISAIYGGCAWEAFGLAGFYSNAPSGRSTCVHPSPLFDRIGDGSNLKLELDHE